MWRLTACWKVTVVAAACYRIDNDNDTDEQLSLLKTRNGNFTKLLKRVIF
jgi:hypothetical protein